LCFEQFTGNESSGVIFTGVNFQPGGEPRQNILNAFYTGDRI
jgi:hypothetical protein